MTRTDPANLDSHAQPAPARTDAGINRGGKFLTFFLAGEEYGIEIIKVQEIIGMTGITPVPRTPPFIRGIINLRGKVITIVDLRLKFGLARQAETAQTCIIVVEAAEAVMGVVVDRVSDVLDIEGRNVEDAPSFGAGVETDYILGIAKESGTVRLLLDLDKVVSIEDVIDISVLSAG